jgi:hypothetical protein
MSYRNLRSALIPILIGLTLAACTPRVQIEAPDKPIVINLNVKIEHEVRVKVEKDLDQVLKNNPGLF